MRFRPAAAALSAAAALAFLGPVAAAAPATQPRGESALVTAPADIVVDAARKRVYLSSGPSANKVVSVGFDGRTQKVLDGQFGASGMVLGADGATLYVALAAGDAISAVDTETFTERARYSTGPHSCPAHLARSGTDVWFGYGCDAWTGAVGRLNTAVEPPVPSFNHQTENPDADLKTFERAPLLATGGADDAVVVASQPHISPVNVRLYTRGERGLAETGRQDRGGSNLSELAVRRDGKVFYTAVGSQDHVAGFVADKDMGSAGAWPTGPAPNSAATSPDGTWLAAGARTAAPDRASVFLFAPDSDRPTRTYALPRGQRLTERGLAWSQDGTVLAAVAQYGPHPDPVVHIIDTTRDRPGPGPWQLS